MNQTIYTQTNTTFDMAILLINYSRWGAGYSDRLSYALT